MGKVATTVTGSIRAPREPFYEWLVPGVFYTELGSVLRNAAWMPGVSGTSGTTGPWTTPGSWRTVHTTDGYSAREEVTDARPPDYFAYVVTEFTQPFFKRLVKEARGQWWFTPEGAGGTQAKWTYSFEGRSLIATAFLVPIVKIFWNRYMRAAMNTAKQRAEREVAGGTP